MRKCLVLLILLFHSAFNLHAKHDSVIVKKKYRWSIQCGVNFNYFDGFIIPSFRDKITQNNYLTNYFFVGNYNLKVQTSQWFKFYIEIPRN